MFFSNLYGLKILNPDIDMGFYQTAYQWKSGKPDWFTESMKTWKMTEEEWFESISRKNQIDFGVFDESLLVGLITVDEIEPTIYEAHFDSQRKIDFEKLVNTVLICKEHLFRNGATKIFGWLQSFNRPMLKIYERIGMKRSGISIFRGNYKNRVVEWQHFVLRHGE